jgi:hypothetical protein
MKTKTMKKNKRAIIKNFTKMIFIALAFCFLFVLTIAGPTFTGLTPANGGYQNANFVIVNISSTADGGGDHSVLVDFNNSLIGWWRLNSDTGLNDSSTYSNNGSCTSATCPNFTTSGKLGGAYDFNGTTSINITPSAIYSLNSSTFSLWFNSGGGGNNQVFLASNKYHVVGYNGNWVFRKSTSTTIAFASYDGTSNEEYKEFTTTIVNGVWYHAVIVFNGTNGTLYLNGTPIGTMAHTKIIKLDSVGFSIGDDLGGPNIPFNGTIDDVLIFNRALSAQEVLALYNASNPANQYYNNFTGLTEGSYSYTAYTQNSSGTINSSTRTVTLDATLPQINFTGQTPSNNTYQNYDGVFINISSNDTTTANSQGNHSVFVDFNRSLVAWYKFEQGNGTFFVDSSTWGNNGSCSGTACPNFTTAGMRGGAYVFDGVNDYISKTSVNNINLSNNFSISLWVNFNSFAPVNPRLININDGVYDVQIVRDGTSGKFVTKHSKWETGTNGQSYNTPIANTWYHIVAVFNTSSSNTLFYINGIVQSNSSFSGIGAGSATNSIYLGIRSDFQPTTFLKGTLDDVLIFSRALSSQEIKALYNAQANQYYNNFTG